MDLQLLISLVSLTVASAVNLNCTHQTYVCDGQEVVCNCTAACNETIYWWDNQTISFCSDTKFCGSGNYTRKNGTLHVEVIDCPNSSACSDTFTSRLSYNASLSTSTTIQIGCSSGVINGTTCSPEEPLDSDSVTLPVRNCTAPHYPRNLQLRIESAQCNSSSRHVAITWEAPDVGPSQLPVTNYRLNCTSGEGDNCSETLPGDTTSYDLTVVAGVWYNITVSALSNGRESKDNRQLNINTVKVEDVTSGNSNATIQLHNSNFSSNLTVYYRPCSGSSSTTRQFRPPIRVVQLENLEAETMYCYNITYNGSNITGASTCNGTFNTSSSKELLSGIGAFIIGITLAIFLVHF